MSTAWGTRGGASCWWFRNPCKRRIRIEGSAHPSRQPCAEWETLRSRVLFRVSCCAYASLGRKGCDVRKVGSARRKPTRKRRSNEICRRGYEGRRCDECPEEGPTRGTLLGKGRGGADHLTRHKVPGVPRSSQGYRKGHQQGPAMNVYWKPARGGGKPRHPALHRLGRIDRGVGGVGNSGKEEWRGRGGDDVGSALSVPPVRRNESPPGQELSGVRRKRPIICQRTPESAPYSQLNSP